MSALHWALALAGALFLPGCSEKEAVAEETDLPKFKVEVFSRELLECKDRKGYCARFHVEYPVFESGLTPAVREIVNNAITGAIAQQVTGKSWSDASSPNLEDAARHFFDMYYEANDKASYYAAWEWTTSGDMLFLSENLLSLGIENFNYSGGAHPNTYSIYLNINLKTGKKIELRDLVKNRKALEKLARRAFFQAKGITDSKLGMDSEEIFQFPENFGITEEGLYFFYNPYEAGPYAAGPLDFVLSWKELEGICKISPF